MYLHLNTNNHILILIKIYKNCIIFDRYSLSFLFIRRRCEISNNRFLTKDDTNRSPRFLTTVTAIIRVKVNLYFIDAHAMCVRARVCVLPKS